MGTIYKRGKVYWIKYYHNGKPYYESSKSRAWADAANLLKLREGDAASGKPAGVRFDKVMFEDLVECIIADYAKNDQKRPRVAHLNNFFKNMRVIDISTTKLNAFIALRQEQGAANATINQDLKALRRMFNLGAKEKPAKVNPLQTPSIELLPEDNIKEGYFEDDEYYALLAHLPEHLRGFVQFAYWTGWRVNQIRQLTWKMVNVKEGCIVVPGRIRKGRKGKTRPQTVYFNEPIKEIIERQRSERNLGCPYVFHRHGVQIEDFRFAWNRACRAAKLGYGYRMSTRYVGKWSGKFKEGPTIHDFRRTAARNLVQRAGVPEIIAMQITGHKTRSVFERYNIVTPKALKDAAQRQAEVLTGRGGEKVVTKL